MGKSRSPRTQILIKTSRRDPPHKVLGGISEMRPDGGPNSRSTNGNRQTEDHAHVVYLPSRGPTWSRPPRSPPPERVVRSAPEN